MNIRTIWVENTPPSLFKLSIQFCIQHKPLFADLNATGEFKLKEGLYFPVEICEALFDTCNDENLPVEDNFINIFGDTGSTRLNQISLKDSCLTDQGFNNIAVHNLKKIFLHNCYNLTTTSLEYINEHSDNLVSLHVEHSDIFPDYLSDIHDVPGEQEFDEDDFNSVQESIYEKRRYILKAPRLKQLSLRDINIVQGRNYFNILCKALPNLSHLDLSGATMVQGNGLQKLQFLLNCPHLVSLILYNVKEVKYSLKTLCNLEKLEHLDISQTDRYHLGHDDEEFDQPTKYLEELVTSLPHLKSLDISGTNLAADYSIVGGRGDCSLNDIPGLCCRINNPLDFLGLYKTLNNDDASRRRHIPAKVIAGSSNEEQLIVAAKRYFDRPYVMVDLLQDFSRLANNGSVESVDDVMDITVTVAERFPNDKKIQNIAVIILYYLLLESSSRFFNVKVKKRILSLLLEIMERYREHDMVLIKHCFTVLWRFRIPEDLMCSFQRIVDMLIVTGEYYCYRESDEYIQKSVVHMLNSISCHVYGDQKREVGIKVIDSMLNIVRIKLSKNLCDDMMEVAWSVMWNVTDETEENSERFLDQCGMELFLECKDKFPLNLDLLKNMMGLLGNVAEVKSCRKRLMSPKFIEEFSFLLDSQKDGIEVSYNAAGVLSHIASDGDHVWTCAQPQRDHVLERLARAVNRWDIKTKRNINYRSLEPIISLLTVSHTPECQLWATWALANLTLFDEDKYCPLVEEEGGLEAVQRIMEDILRESLTEATHCPIRQKLLELGQRATHNILEWKRKMAKIEETGGLIVSEIGESGYLIKISENKRQNL